MVDLHFDRLFYRFVSVLMTFTLWGQRKTFSQRG